MILLTVRQWGIREKSIDLMTKAEEQERTLLQQMPEVDDMNQSSIPKVLSVSQLSQMVIEGIYLLALALWRTPGLAVLCL